MGQNHGDGAARGTRRRPTLPAGAGRGKLPEGGSGDLGLTPLTPSSCSIDDVIGGVTFGRPNCSGTGNRRYFFYPETLLVCDRMEMAKDPAYF